MQEILQPQEFNNTAISLLSGILDEVKKQRVSDDLWTVDDIAAYLKKSPKTVYNGIVNQTNFPLAIRVPNGESKGRPLWKSKEVKAWVDRFREAKK